MTQREKRENAAFLDHPTREKARSAVIADVRAQCQEAKALPVEERTGSRGNGIGISICAVLIWNQNWINERDDPELSEMLDISVQLDIDANDENAWQRLFELSEKVARE